MFAFLRLLRCSQVKRLMTYTNNLSCGNLSLANVWNIADRIYSCNINDNNSFLVWEDDIVREFPTLIDV